MQANRTMLAGIRGFLLDMDGTVYLGNKLIDGTLDFLARLRETGRSVLYVTNNSSRNVEYYQSKLKRLGVEAQREQILTSGLAAADLLRRDYPNARVWILGNDYLKQEMAEQGIHVVDDAPDVVLAGYDNTLTYQKLVEVCDYVRAGLPYIATHPDFNCPIEGGFEPDLGSFMALIEASTGRKADRVAGKPEVELILSAQKRLGAERNEIAMCGDRLYTDIAAGKKHGLLSILVLSGEAKEEDIPKAAYQPDIVVPKLSALNAFL